MSRPAHDGSHHSDHKTPSNKGSESNVCSVDTSDISTVVPPGRSTWRSLFAFTKWSHAALLAAAIAAAGVAAALKTVLAVVLGQIFDVIGAFGNGIQSGTTTVAEVARWAVILVMLGIGNWAANSAFVALWVAFGELQANSVRNEVFQSLLSRNIAWFDEQEQGISSLLVRIETQTRELQLATSQVFGLFVCDVATALASLGVAFYYSWKLTLVLLATLPVSATILSIATRPLEYSIQAQRSDLAEASKHVNAAVNAIDLVKVFNGFEYEHRKYRYAIQNAAKHYLVQARCNSVQMGYVAFWVLAMFVAGFWYGMALVEQGMSAGSILTTFYATLACFQGIEALMPHWLVFSKGMSAGGFLLNVSRNHCRGKQTKDAKAQLRPNTCDGDVELSNVSFTYPSNPDNKALSQCSLFFPSGDMTFIVGRSGSGKSTIGCLIAKFYEPTTGNITIDGHPFQALDPKWINEHITLVQQTSVLFNDTFFNNVACGHKVPGCISAEKVLAACSDVMLQPTISALPQGIDTNVGPEGHTLSGGEKQRLALARARLRNPPVLILDEVTSGLDPINREMVMTSLRKWRRGKTTIVITHDFSQIDENDFVYVFNSSVLVQEGFKRNLRGEKDDRAISGTGIEERKRKGGPSLTIMVTPPDHPGNSSETLNISPDTPVFPSRSARLTDRFLSGFTARGNQHRISHRMSLGIHPDYARRSRIEQAGAGSDMSKWPWVVRGAEPNDFNDERSRFSKYVSKRFLLEDFKDIELSPISCHQTIDLALPSPTSLGTGPEARSESLRQSSDKSDSRLPDIVLVSQDEEDRSTPTQECTTDPFATPSEFDRPSPLVKAAQKQASLATILKTVWPVLNTRTRVTLMLGILVSMIGAASTPIFSYCFAQLLGVMTSPGDKLEKGTKWAVLILALAITDGAGWGGGRYLLERTAQAWVNSIRSEALRRILLQPKPWFERNKNSATRITECLDRNAEEMRNIVGKFIPIVISVVTMMSISVTWAFVVSWKLTLVSLAPLPAVMGAVKGYTLISGNWETKCNKGAQSASSSMAEIMTNIRVVRAFTLEEYFSNKYKTTVAETLSLGMRRAALTCGFYGLYQSLNYPMTALVFYYGTVLLATKRELSIAEVMQVVNFLLFSIGTSAGLLSSIPQLTIAQATASQMLGYIEMSTEPPEGHRGKQLAYPALPVSITNLEFFHPRHPQKQILYGTCFDINPAQCTAIVGPSGCGKSTIISLLLGLHPLPTPPHQTRSPISFSGVPYSKVDIECLRLSMGYVAQSPFLFPATIAENIAYGLPEDSPYRKPRDICRAAEDAGLHRWILSLPDGYNTFVGDGGQPMSGGQAQRLNIARALVRRPRLLVLDEPTSSLDTDNANIIRRTIRKLSAQGGPMGIVMVTHSRDMMRVADKIVVLGDGGVTLEQGTYDDLLRKGGAFTALIRNEERHSSLHALGID